MYEWRIAVGEGTVGLESVCLFVCLFVGAVFIAGANFLSVHIVVGGRRLV